MPGCPHMIKKAKTHDILDELLSTTTHEVPPEIQELTDFIDRQGEHQGEPDKIVRRSSSMTRRTKKTKKKITHYLSEETYNGLDNAKEKIRQIVPLEIKTGVSKSKIVDHALKMILQDFETKGKNSSLVKFLLENSQKTQEK